MRETKFLFPSLQLSFDIGCATYFHVNFYFNFLEKITPHVFCRRHFYFDFNFYFLEKKLNFSRSECVDFTGRKT